MLNHDRMLSKYKPRLLEICPVGNVYRRILILSEICPVRNWYCRKYIRSEIGIVGNMSSQKIRRREIGNEKLTVRKKFLS